MAMNDNRNDSKALFDKFAKTFQDNTIDVLAYRNRILQKIQTDSEDLRFLVTIFMTKGKYIEKFKNMTTVESNRLKVLKERLGYKNRRGEGETIALFKIVDAFPEIVISILLEYPNMAGPVSWNSLKSMVGYEDFPSIARQPSLACLLPQNHPNTQLILNAFFISNMMICEQENITDLWKKMTPEEKDIDAKMNFHMDWNSKILNTGERAMWCQKLGIIVNGQYTETWQRAGEKSKAKLLQIYKVAI